MHQLTSLKYWKYFSIQHPSAMMIYCPLDPKNKHQLKFEPSAGTYFQENTLNTISAILFRPQDFDILGLLDAYTCHFIGSSLTQVMFCCLLSAKPSPDPMPNQYCVLEPSEETSVKFKPITAISL